MNKKPKERLHKLNGEIQHNTLRVGEHGIISLKEAIKLADAEELDLVLINENAVPPVCKIMDYEKYIYQLSKTPKHKSLDIKEVKLGPNMSENDLSYRTEHIVSFLNKGHKVKLSMQFRGRQMAFVDIGQALMLKLIVSIEDHGSPEAIPKLEGKKMLCTLKPKPKK